MIDARQARKTVGALFALVLGLGYLSALANLYFSVPISGDKAIPSVADIAAHYHGHPESTLLETKLRGSMRVNLKDEAQFQTIAGWIKGGATQDSFGPVKEIIDAQCIRCHVKDGMAAFRALTTYEEVAATTTVDRGMSWPMMARITHIHLFGIGALCFILAWILLHTPYPPRFVVAAAALGIFGLIIDFGGMWLTKLNPIFAYLIVAGGGMTGLYFGVSVFAIWWDFFFGKAEAKP